MLNSWPGTLDGVSSQILPNLRSVNIAWDAIKQKHSVGSYRTVNDVVFKSTGKQLCFEVRFKAFELTAGTFRDQSFAINWKESVLLTVLPTIDAGVNFGKSSITC